MSIVTWHPIAECPAELMDGRTVLAYYRGSRKATTAYYGASGRWFLLVGPVPFDRPDFVADLPEGPEVGS
jgi:hypothetical protein